MLWLTLLSCGEKTLSVDTGNDAQNLGIEARLLLVSLNNRPQIEIAVRSDFDNLTTFTEEDGVTNLLAEPGAPFVFTATENDSLQHRYVGYAPSEPFELEALFLDRGSWLSLLGGVDLEEKIAHGHIWVSIVDGEFNPIPGARATLNAPSDPPFVLLETNVPWAQDSIDETGKETLFFPNVPPQDVDVTISTPTDLTCNLRVDHPTQGTASTTVYANTASILWFVCSE